MNTPKKFYALSDGCTGDYPLGYSSGFASTKEVIFFTSARLRDEWIEETNLTTARALKRSEALRLSKRSGKGDCIARPVEQRGREFISNYEVIRESKVNI